MADKPNGQGSRRRIIIPILLGLVIIAIAIGIPYLIYAANHVSTDDAQLDGNITMIAPKVKGQITYVNVGDNKIVHKGDLLVRLDDRDLRAAVAQAQAALAQALASNAAAAISVPQQEAMTSAQIAQANAGLGQGQSELQTAQAALAAVQAQLDAAQANLVKAQRDQERSQMLVASGAISRSQADATWAAYQAALASRNAAAENVRQARAGIDRARAQMQANSAQLAQAQTGFDTTKIKQAQVETASAAVVAARANLAAAELQLSYATIRAPIDGVLSKRGVNVGDFVSVGQPLMAVVDQKNVWITANLKETQMANVRIGQPVSIKVDAFPHEQFRGAVESIAPATGSTFALIPPDNATGNYTKVVQRVPVRIAIDMTSDPQGLLRQGLSAVITIDTSKH